MLNKLFNWFGFTEEERKDIIKRIYDNLTTFNSRGNNSIY